MEIIKAIDFKACVPVAITESVIKMMPDAMVVGRCKDCSHWQDAGGCGVCDLFSGDITGPLSTDWGPITTKPDFGCVEWEAREETE